MRKIRYHALFLLISAMVSHAYSQPTSSAKPLPFSAYFGRITSNQGGLRCNSDPYSFCQIAEFDPSLAAEKAIPVTLTPTTLGLLRMSVPVSILQLPIGKQFSDGIFHLPSDVELTPEVVGYISKCLGKHEVQGTSLRLAQGSYNYQATGDVIDIENITYNLPVDFTPPVFHQLYPCAPWSIRFSCNYPASPGLCVVITGPNAPANPIPWVGYNFQSPSFWAVHGQVYAVEIIFCNGGHAFPTNMGGPFPFTNAILVRPFQRCDPALADISYAYKMLPATQDLEVELFPNPATHQITLRYDQLNEMTAGITIFDLLGKSYTVKILEANDFELRLDISILPAGTYILRSMTSAGMTSKKFQKL